MNEDLKELLSNNNLSEYIPLLEKEKIYCVEDLKELTQDDYKELGIVALGDRKRFVKLFSQNEKQLTVIQENENGEEKKQQEEKQNTIVINNSEKSTAHTGIAGVLGGIIGAVAVIAIILIILSNESFSL